MSRTIVGAFLCGTAVGLGAFGAHALSQRLHLSEQYLETWKTATLYQFLHGLALLALEGVGLPEAARRQVAALFVAGAAIFSGSLYLLALSSLRPEGALRWLGAITPLGGVCFLAGWMILGLGARRVR